MPLIQVTSGGQRSLLKKKLQVCESQQSCLFVGDQILIFHHNLQINSLKILQCDFLDVFSYFVSHSWGKPMMKITGLSHLFKWENLHNWWLTKYFFAPLYVCTVHIYCVYINTHTYSKYFENIYMYIFIFLYYTLCIFNKYKLFLKYIHACVCIYIYTVHTHILIKQNLLFWMGLITINRLTALSATYHYCEIELFTSWHNILVISPISIKDSKFQKNHFKIFCIYIFPWITNPHSPV